MIERLDATAYRNISSKASIKFRNIQYDGYGRTIMTSLTMVLKV